MINKVFYACINDSWPLLAVVCVTFLVFRLSYFRNHRESVKLYEEFGSLIAIIYILLLFQIVTNVDLNTSGGMNLIPFKEMFRYQIPSEGFWLNVVGNILAFVPFGFIACSYIKPKGAWSNLINSVIISSTIEFIQLAIGRSFDVDDIILNVFGCMIGYFIYVICKKIYNILPSFMHSKSFKNFISFSLIAGIIIYALYVLGVL